jgi:spermidine/putrescine transport system permease protein
MTQALGESGAAGGPAPVGDGRETPKRRGWGWLLLVPGMLWLLVFFIYPTIQLFFTSLYDPSGSFEQGYTMTWHFANYTDAIADTWNLFARSFLYAGIATIVCLILGYPLAYAIAFKAGRWKYVMLVLVIAPFLTSFLLRTLAWRTILSDNGFVTSSLQTIGVLPDDGRLLATPIAVVAGLIYNFLPFMTLPLYASLDKVDPRLIEAAGDLYSRPFEGFRKVTFPLSMPGVVSGTLLTFIPACGDYINAELLGTPKQYMVGNRIQAAFLTEHNYPLAASLSIILMLVVVVMVIFYVRRAGTEELI